MVDTGDTIVILRQKTSINNLVACVSFYYNAKTPHNLLFCNQQNPALPNSILRSIPACESTSLTALSSSKSARMRAATASSVRIFQPVIAIPFAACKQRSCDSLVPATAVKPGVWLLQPGCAGTPTYAWKAGHTYVTFPNSMVRLVPQSRIYHYLP